MAAEVRTSEIQLVNSRASDAGPTPPTIAVGRKISGFADLGSERKCTDCFFLILFILYWIGLVIVAIISSETGEIERLLYGVDVNGVVCGTGVNEGKYNIYYPSLQEDLSVALLEGVTSPFDVPLSGVCLDSCPQPDDTTLPECEDQYGTTRRCVPAPYPTTNNTLVPVVLPTSDIFYRCIQEQVVNSVVTVRCVDPPTCEAAAGKSSSESCDAPLQSKYDNGVDCSGKSCKAALESYFDNCAYAQTNTSTVQLSGAKDDPLYDSLQEWGRLLSRWIGDLQKSAAVIMILGGLGSLLLSTGWLVFLRYCTDCFVWTTVFLMYGTLLALTFVLLLWGNVIDAEKVTAASSRLAGDVGVTIDDSAFTYLNQEAVAYEDYYATLGYCMLVVDAIFLLVLIFMWSRIRVSIGIIKESTKTLASMPSIILVPIISVVITVFASLYFLVVAGYIASTDDITEGDVLIAGLTVNLNGTAYSDDNVWHGVLAYHLFGWLWTVQMIDAVTYLIIAGAASEWYFSLDKSDLSFAPVCAATYRTFRYHLGTAAFGSMLIAMVDFVRGMVEYVVGKSKGLEKQSAVAKAMMCIVRCCLWCLKKCLRFISENAFIMTAAQGTSFYTSMKKAFSLITNNFARIATVATMSWFVLFLGRVLVTSVCCLIVIIIVYEDPAAQIKGLNNLDFNDVSSPILPAAVTIFIAWGTAHLFTNVYQTIIDTILLCFCWDLDNFEKNGHYYMSEELLRYINKDAREMAFKKHKSSASFMHTNTGTDKPDMGVGLGRT